MKTSTFEYLVTGLGAMFAVAFVVLVVPAAMQSMDIVGAFAAGFVNPFATGYSLDAVACGLILMVWVIYERRALKIRYGWIVIPLAVIPGVATAFGFYLVIRSRQLAGR